MNKDYLDKVVYFKSILECEQFLTHIQNKTDIRWRSGTNPLNKDLEVMMYGRARKTPFAISITIGNGKLQLEYGSKSSYEDMNEHDGYNLEIIPFGVFISRLEGYKRF